MSPFTCTGTGYSLDCTSHAIKIDGNYFIDSKKIWTTVQEHTSIHYTCTKVQCRERKQLCIMGTVLLWALELLWTFSQQDTQSTESGGDGQTVCGALPATQYSTSEPAPKGL